MQGIDISNWQGTLFNSTVSKAFKESDFVIIKATEGVSFVSSTMKSQANKAIKAGKLLGFYHYADGGDAKKEAKHFVDTVKNYIGEALLFVDWEATNNKSFGKDPDWCKRFLDEVYKLTGCLGGVYVSASALKQVKSCCPDYKLWLAGYPYGFNSWSVPQVRYVTEPWLTYDIWQFTSSGGRIDRNTTDMNRQEWLAAEKIITPCYEYTVKLGTNARTRRNFITGKVKYKLKKGQRVMVDRTVTDKNGRVWGHIGKYRWFVIESKNGIRAVRS